MADDKQLKIRVDPNLHRRAKVKAAERDTTLSEVIRDCLLVFVGDRPTSKKERTVTRKS